MDKLLVIEETSTVLLICEVRIGEKIALRVGWYIFICSLA